MAGNDKPTDSSGEVARDYELYRAESFKQVFDLYKETMELKEVIVKKDAEIANLKSVIAEKETEFKQNIASIEQKYRSKINTLETDIVMERGENEDYRCIVSSNINKFDHLNAELISLANEIEEYKSNMRKQLPHSSQDDYYDDDSDD